MFNKKYKKFIFILSNILLTITIISLFYEEFMYIIMNNVILKSIYLISIYIVITTFIL